MIHQNFVQRTQIIASSIHDTQLLQEKTKEY